MLSQPAFLLDLAGPGVVVDVGILAEVSKLIFFLGSLGKQRTTGNPLKSIQNGLIIFFEHNKRFKIKSG